MVLKQDGVSGIDGWTVEVDGFQVPSVVNAILETGVGEIPHLTLKVYATELDIEAWPVHVEVVSLPRGEDQTVLGMASRDLHAPVNGDG